ncbi:MAG: hypothetical protein JNK46_19020 [Methylobacteriaceae bacterium]|nr:hypothetical protein [Methylobacteriaceae bacterium]
MRRVATSLSCAILLAGCLGETPPQVAASAPAPAPAAAPARPALAGALAGPLGQGLTDADRDAAFAAQLAALDAGQRKTWRGGPKGAFGYVEPGPEAGGCRDYAHTIYVAGRPRAGKGQACRDAATGWRIAS